MRWKTRDGVEMEISEMADGHLLNSIKMIRSEIEDRILKAFPIDPFLPPPGVIQRREQLFKNTLMGDRAYSALMNEAVKRRLMDWDGKPMPWERTPFIPPPEEKKADVNSAKSREVRITQQKTLADKIARANQKSAAEKLKKRIDWIRQKEADIRSGAIFEDATPESIRKEMEAISETYRERPKKQNKKSDDVPVAEWKPGKRRIVID